MNFLKAPRQYIKYRSRSPSPVPRLGGFEYREDRDRVSNPGPLSVPGLKPEQSRDSTYKEQVLPIGQSDLPPPAYAETEMIQEPEDGAARRRNNRSRQLDQLKHFDTTFILDDSGSMRREVSEEDKRSRWSQAKRILKEVAQIAIDYDQDGVDVWCINQPTPSSSSNKKMTYETKRALDRLLDSLSPPTGRTPLDRSLTVILKRHMDSLREKQKEGEITKPINIIIITDGAPDSKPAVEDIIVKHARVLREEYLDSQIGIQFVQVGHEKAATAYLQYLDKLKERYPNLPIVDIVDTVHAQALVSTKTQLPSESSLEVRETETFSEDMLIKVLLGGINKNIDIDDEDVEDEVNCIIAGEAEMDVV